MSASEIKTIEIEVLRYRPEQDTEPFWQSFQVEFAHDTSVLEGLQSIKDDQDASLSYRWSCRMAICGSCGMMIDAKPKLACSTFLRDFWPNKVRVGPLEHFPIERDLVVAADDFIDKLERITAYLVPKEPRTIEQGEYLQTPRQLQQFLQYSGCINCMLCYAACPEYGLNEKFLGPGLLALMHRYNDDSRDGGRDGRMELMNAEEGVWVCTAVTYCSEVCPKKVDPANAVNQNKLNSALGYFGRFLTSQGGQK